MPPTASRLRGAGGEDRRLVGEADVCRAWRGVLEEALVVFQTGDIDLGVENAFDLTGRRIPGLAAIGEHERVGIAGDVIVDLRPLEDRAVEIVVRAGEVLADALVPVDVDLEPLIVRLRQILAVVGGLVGVPLRLVRSSGPGARRARWCRPPAGTRRCCPSRRGRSGSRSPRPPRTGYRARGSAAMMSFRRTIQPGSASAPSHWLSEMMMLYWATSDWSDVAAFWKR